MITRKNATTLMFQCDDGFVIKKDVCPIWLVGPLPMYLQYTGTDSVVIVMIVPSGSHHASLVFYERAHALS
jgi:hypothetical protein